MNNIDISFISEYIWKGNEAMLKHQYSNAIKYYEAARDNSPPDYDLSTILSNLSVAYKKMGIKPTQKTAFFQTHQYNKIQIPNSTTPSYTDFSSSNLYDRLYEKTWLQPLSILCERITRTAAALPPYIARAQNYKKRKDYQNALLDYQTAAEISPNNPNIWIYLAQAAIQRSEFDIAFNAVKKVEQLGAPCLNVHANLRWAAHMFTEAAYFLENSLKTSNDPKSYALYARLNFAVGDVGIAWSRLNGAITNIKKESDILLQQCLSLIASPILPSKIPIKTQYSDYLAKMLNAIYRSLNCKISSIPLDLWLPEEYQKSWALFHPQPDPISVSFYWTFNHSLGLYAKNSKNSMYNDQSSEKKRRPIPCPPGYSQGIIASNQQGLSFNSINKLQAIYNPSNAYSQNSRMENLDHLEKEKLDAQNDTSFLFSKDLAFLIPAGKKKGSLLMAATVNHRAHTCIGLAYIQLVQQLISESPRKSPLDLESAVAIIGNWIRLFDPIAPIFWRRSSPSIIYLQKDGIMTELLTYTKRITLIMGSELSKTAKSPLAEKLAAAKTPEEIYGILRCDVCIPIGSQNPYKDQSTQNTSDKNPKNNTQNSNSNITHAFLRLTSTRGVDFGVCLPPPDEKNANYHHLQLLWSKIMLLFYSKRQFNQKIPFRIESQDIKLFSTLSFQFFFEWLKQVPMTSYSAEIGITLFFSLICAYLGLEPNIEVPMPIVLQLEAMIAPNFDSFKDVLMSNVVLDLIPSNILIFPIVTKSMTNYIDRIKALLVYDHSKSLDDGEEEMDNESVVDDEIIGATEEEDQIQLLEINQSNNIVSNNQTNITHSDDTTSFNDINADVD